MARIGENTENTTTNESDEGSTILEIRTDSGTNSDIGGNNEQDTSGKDGQDSENGNKTKQTIGATIKVISDYDIVAAKMKVGYGNNISRLTNILNASDGDYCCIYDSSSNTGNYNPKTGIMNLAGVVNYDLEIDNNATSYYVFFYFKTAGENHIDKLNSKCIQMTGAQLVGNTAFSLTASNIKDSNDYEFYDHSNHQTTQQNTEN